MTTIKQALEQACRRLTGSGDSALPDARVLLCHTLQCPQSHLYTWPEAELGAERLAHYQTLVEQRRQGAPVAYLTGRREFWSLDFEVGPHTLIPRPETELLVETVLRKTPATAPVRLLDLGTGSGVIAIALACERPHWQITATDLSEAALKVAKRNASAHRCARIDFACGRWFEPLPPSHFDVIVSNPPYIDPQDPHLHQGDLRHEPRLALCAEEQGMADIRHLCQHAGQWLAPGGLFLLEHGYDQQQAVHDCLQQHHFEAIFQLKDLAGHIRVSGGYRRG